MILFDLDDTSPAKDTNAINWMIDFKDRYPDFKVTLFTILGTWTNLELLEGICCFDFIELAAHGFFHESNDECQQWDVDDWHHAIDMYEQTDLFVPIFKAPNWQMSTLGYQVLNKRGWAVAVRGTQIDEVPEGMKYYSYEEQGGIHGHTWLMSSHVQNKWFVDWGRHSEFGFISDHLRTK